MSAALDRIKDWRAHYERVRSSLGPAVHIAWGDPDRNEPGSLLLADLDAVLADIDRLTAERDEARAEATRLREALAASLDHCKTWHGDCCPCEGGPNGEDFCSAGETVDKILAAIAPPTDQGEAL